MANNTALDKINALSKAEYAYRETAIEWLKEYGRDEYTFTHDNNDPDIVIDDTPVDTIFVKDDRLFVAGRLTTGIAATKLTTAQLAQIVEYVKYTEDVVLEDEVYMWQIRITKGECADDEGTPCGLWDFSVFHTKEDAMKWLAQNYKGTKYDYEIIPYNEGDIEEPVFIENV